MVVTTLFKDDIAPCIRFNTHDITHELTGTNQTGMVFNRIAGFKGRSDNMAHSERCGNTFAEKSLSTDSSFVGDEWTPQPYFYPCGSVLPGDSVGRRGMMTKSR